MTLTQWQTQRDPKALPNLIRICVAADALGICVDKLTDLIRGGTLATAPVTGQRIDFVQFPSLARLARMSDLDRRQTLFNRMPLLMPAGTFADWCGISVSTIHRWVSQRRLSICIPPGNVQGMHYKSELARITGYQF